MRLTMRQQLVLSNSLAWCDTGYEPTGDEVQAFFAWNDRGVKWPVGLSADLVLGWTAHYSNPFAWIAAYEAGGNPPISPPAAWIYDAYWNPESLQVGWEGWLPIMIDCWQNWKRRRPAYYKVREILLTLRPR